MKWDAPGGSVRAESCRHPSKSSSLCSRAKNVVAPPRPPVRFFAPDAPVVDLYLGQIDQVERLRSVAEISLVFFYAPWCAHSIAARQELQQVAKKLARQVRRSWRQNRQRGPPRPPLTACSALLQVQFVAVNCWWSQGKCRRQHHFFQFPAIHLFYRRWDGKRCPRRLVHRDSGGSFTQHQLGASLGTFLEH